MGLNQSRYDNRDAKILCTPDQCVIAVDSCKDMHHIEISEPMTDRVDQHHLMAGATVGLRRFEHLDLKSTHGLKQRWV